MWKMGFFMYQESKIIKLRIFVFIPLPVHISFFCKNDLVSSIIAPKRDKTTPKGPPVKALTVTTLDCARAQHPLGTLVLESTYGRGPEFDSRMYRFDSQEKGLGWRPVFENLQVKDQPMPVCE